MKTVFEIIGASIVSLFLMAIPILCALSFAYNWYPGLIFILSVACSVEYLWLMDLLLDISDKQDKK